MNWWREFDDRIECDVPLDRLTWFHVGGPARYLFRPDTPDVLAVLLKRARQEGVSVRVLGAGANVLVDDDGFDGVVVRLDAPAFTFHRDNGDGYTVGAGVDLMPLARACSEQGRCGLEGLAGIPGTIGGAVRMNAGGRFGEMSQVIRTVDVMLCDGTIESWSNDRIGFGYRRSDLDGCIVLSATLSLHDDDPVVTKKRFDERFEYKQRSQPLVDKSAGCIFKNPPGESAGTLIDRAGLKGTCVGGACVSEVHANFIVAERGATAADILRLIDTVRDRVDRAFGTRLELEIDVWRSESRTSQVC